VAVVAGLELTFERISDGCSAVPLQDRRDGVENIAGLALRPVSPLREHSRAKD
jgi:hypothetical protein